MNEGWERIVESFCNCLEVKTNVKTSDQYKQVSNAFVEVKAFITEAEKKFIEICPLLIAADRTEDMIKLLGLVRKSVCMYDWGKNKKSYKTYCRRFVDYLESFINSTSKSNKDLKKQIKEKVKNPSQQLGNYEQLLKDAFENNEIFLHDCLHVKFKSRLRRQERTSGDKIWLPLSFIAKLYRQKKDDGFSKWLDNLVDDIYIHYLDTDDDEKIKSVSFKKNQIFLDFEKNKDGEYEVYVIWSRTGVRYRAYTPTGIGNEKKPMTVRDISEIDIDHIKPIDQTLRDLGKANKLKTLKTVSDSYKTMLEAMSKDENNTKIEKETLRIIIDDIDISRLTEELDLIRKDGLLRLMTSKYNERKSNSSTFDRIIKNNSTNEYWGIIGEACYRDNYGERKIWLYNNLNEQYAGIKATPNKPSGDEVKISKELIDFI